MVGRSVPDINSERGRESWRQAPWVCSPAVCLRHIPHPGAVQILFVGDGRGHSMTQ